MCIRDSPFDRGHVAGRKSRKKRLMTSISFEFFPPKSEAAGEKLWQAIGRLAPLRPDFVSVTYGAGGSTRDRTHQCVKRIIDETDLKPAAHLTCVAASRTDVDSVVDDYAAAGVQHIVALRGDMPDMGAFQAHAEGYDGSVALVAALANAATNATEPS